MYLRSEPKSGNMIKKIVATYDNDNPKLPVMNLPRSYNGTALGFAEQLLAGVGGLQQGACLTSSSTPTQLLCKPSSP